MRKKSIKVVVAMSGGVDSSVSAALLVKAGFDVIGLMAKFGNLDEINGRDNLCCTAESAAIARQVARKLKIPFYVVNLAQEFQKTVINNFIVEYQAGRTPNPCVICNREIKFGLLMKKALSLGAELMATGHYCQVKKDKEGVFHLYRGVDRTKDQSYFLWALNQKQLSRSLLPLGNLTKTEVRKLAKKYHLPSFERKESQGICFIRDKLQDFLAEYIKGKPGKIIDKEGHILARHHGLQFYTIGQREGLGLGGPKKYYVIKLDSKNNNLIVGNEEELYQRELVAEKPNFILGRLPCRKMEAAIRYGHPAVNCQISSLHNQSKSLKIKFSEPVRAITPGQSIVFYDKDEVLGGAIIKAQN